VYRVFRVTSFKGIGRLTPSLDDVLLDDG
jgi:hypothetical protein